MANFPQHFQQQYQSHLKHLKLKGLQPKTIEAYARGMRRIGEYFSYQVDALSEEQLVEYFTDLLDKHSWSGVKLDLYGLKFFTEHVLRKPWAMPNFIRPPKVSRLPDIVSVAEAQSLFGATRVLSYRVFFFTLYSLGLRLGEALALTVGDIDAQRMRVHVRDAKGNRDRLVPLPQQTLRVLRRHWRVHQHPRLLFPNRAGGLHGARAAPGGGGLRAKKNITPHSLRHYSESGNMPSRVADTLAAAGVDPAYSCASQLLEEGHQLVIGPESRDPGLARFDLVQCCLLDVEVRIEIDLRGLDRLMAEPQRDDAAVGAGLKQLHGRRVAQHVRCHMLVAQSRTALTGPIHVLGHKIVHAVGAEAMAARAGKDDRLILGGDLAQPGPQDISRRSGQRRRSLLATLAKDANMCPCSQTHGAATQARDLRQTQTRLHGHEHECVVTPPAQGAQVRRAQQGVCLLAREKADLRSSAAHAGNGQHALNLRRVLRHLERRVAKERANGRQAQVAAARTDAAAVLQVLQERGDQRCVDLFELETLWCNAKPLLREAQQLPKAVAVRGDRVGAALALLHQPAREEGLQQRRKSRRAHERCSQRRSTRAMASAMSCGCALKYQ
jgi:integrase/recombinase XerD